ncbi:FMN-binding protein [Streptomyces sp. NPDC026672]|uniref:FMN-binding protein n=1 Tax=unclassified Streptomyces TaxID=2593676 RepID=UPI0033CFC36C
MRKSHPLRRVVLATAATVSGVVLLLSLKPATDPTAAAAPPPQQQSGAAGAQESPQGGAQAAGAGTVTGDAAQTAYGIVQVRLTVSGGRITRAEAVRAPDDEQSDGAVPKLNQAVVAAQSARIDSVSGATYTSDGYKASLQSALDKVKDSPVTPVGRTVTGKTVRTQYGPVQVRITVSGNKVVRAEAAQAPKDERSEQAVPRLDRAAVATGNALFDSVSGATYTSEGYKQSLQSALDQVR